MDIKPPFIGIPGKYILVSPIKDEANYIHETIESVIQQTKLPYRWIIVDDGSTDGTTNLVRTYCERFDWIQLIIHDHQGKRNTGSAEVLAFNLGYELVKGEDFDFIVKLDGDLRLEPDYFECLLNEFHNNSELGIASGIYLEDHGRGWKPIGMPKYHAAGASKVIRKQCFDDIGGFITAPGWDTVDEIKAQYRGWKTAHFKVALFYHLKNEGSGMGFQRTNIMHGEIFYLTGGTKYIFFLKMVRRMIFGRPILIGGIYMLYGYMRSLLQSKPLLINYEEAKQYRKMLGERITFSVFGRT